MAPLLNIQSSINQTIPQFEICSLWDETDIHLILESSKDLISHGADVNRVNILHENEDMCNMSSGRWELHDGQNALHLLYLR
jgi:ankyrin repeat protein